MTTRVRRTFWGLVVVAIVATGMLSRALAAEPGPTAGLTVAWSATLLVISVSLGLRILVVVERRAARAEQSPHESGKT